MLYIAYEQSAVFFSAGKFSPLFTNLFYYGCNIALFYFHWWMLDRTAGTPRPRYLAAFVFTAVELIFFLLLKYGGNLIFFNGHHATAHDLIITSVWDIHRIVYFIGMSTLIWASGHIGRFQQRATEAEKLQLLADRERAVLSARLAGVQNAYHQHQLNPHLLFNTLSFIHNSVYAVSENAARCVLLLSDVVRFTVTEADGEGKILLTDEIAQIGNLVEINRLRFDGQLHMDVNVQGDAAGLSIIPLILLTLTENLFKHGLVTDAEHVARVDIRIDDRGRLLYVCRNRKKRITKREPSLSHMGIRNVRIRLDQAYPNRYSLNLMESDDDFCIELTLIL